MTLQLPENKRDEGQRISSGGDGCLTSVSFSRWRCYTRPLSGSRRAFMRSTLGTLLLFTLMAVLCEVKGRFTGLIVSSKAAPGDGACGRIIGETARCESRTGLSPGLREATDGERVAHAVSPALRISSAYARNDSSA